MGSGDRGVALTQDIAHVRIYLNEIGVKLNKWMTSMS